VLQPGSLLATLRQLSGQAHGRLNCVLAWSGGLDSTVLLHALLRLRSSHPREISLRALHVDHHLQRQSAAFRRHCARIAKRDRLPLQMLHARIDRVAGGSLEELARDERYRLLASRLKAGDLLLTAQHGDDQLETVLLALMRGAGVAGLAAMPAASTLGLGMLLRPLLGVSRSQLHRHAQEQGLEWMEDPSNLSLQFDRNYLRSRILPAVRERWPGSARTVARSARHCAEAMRLVESQSRTDLGLALDGEDLQIAVLRRWSPARQKNVLRAWFTHRGARPPEERRLAESLRLLDARLDARPLLEWDGWQLRRHHGCLLLAAAARVKPVPVPDPASSLVWNWRKSGTLILPDSSVVQILDDPHGDLDPRRLPAKLQVARASDHEGPFRRGEGRRLRKLLQELQVPAWERARLPVFYAPATDGASGQLLAIADLWLAEPLRATSGTRKRLRLRWRQQA
jgi:tRNA(Ile)-lysidine synthase